MIVAAAISLAVYLYIVNTPLLLGKVSQFYSQRHRRVPFVNGHLS